VIERDREREREREVWCATKDRYNCGVFKIEILDIFILQLSNIVDGAHPTKCYL
jgi:hypothetical protein